MKSRHYQIKTNYNNNNGVTTMREFKVLQIYVIIFQFTVTVILNSFSRAVSRLRFLCKKVKKLYGKTLGLFFIL